MVPLDTPPDDTPPIPATTGDGPAITTGGGPGALARDGLVPISTRDELTRLTGPEDAFARLDPRAEVRGWADGHAVAIIRTAGRRPPSLFVWGAKVGPLLDALTDRLPTLGIVGISVPRDHLHALTRRFTVLGGGDWDWMWTTRDTVPDPGLTLVDLDDTRDAAEIAALAAENPRFEGYPGTGTSESWIGWRDDGGHLIACGATQRLPSGVAHLGGILVASRWRGRGLGTAVSAALTARAVATDGVCTLGMYADNDAARSVYERLGYVVDKAWASRTVDLR